MAESVLVQLLAVGGAKAEPLGEHLSDRYETTFVDAPAPPSDAAEVVVISARKCNQALLDLVAEVAHDRADGRPRIVVVAERIGSSDARLLLVAGAAGLLIAGDADRALVPTIEAVRVGQVCLPPRHAGTAQAPGLTTRERQIVGLVAMDLNNREIAKQLFLAESTIKSHLSSAFGKLGVRTRAEARDLLLDPAFGLSSGVMGLGAAPLIRDTTESSSSPVED